MNVSCAARLVGKIACSPRWLAMKRQLDWMMRSTRSEMLHVKAANRNLDASFIRVHLNLVWKFVVGKGLSSIR